MKGRLKYNNNRDCNYFELTLIRLLYILVMSRVGVVDGNKRAYLHCLGGKLFDGDVE